jgi:hypothetical protein
LKARTYAKENGHRPVPRYGLRREGRKATGREKAGAGDEKRWKSGSVVVERFDLGLGLSAEEQKPRHD